MANAGWDDLSKLMEHIGREELRVTQVRRTPLTWTPPDGSYVEEDGPVVIPSRGVTILEMFTDSGLVGIGPGSPGDEEAIPRLIGQNPFDVAELDLSAGLDVACWDLIGRAKGAPVYELLAIDHDPDPRVHVYASGGVSWTFYDKGDGQPYGADSLIAEALKYKQLGFDTFKWRPGTDWEEAGLTAKKLGDTVCRPLREAVGPGFRLGLEKKAYDVWTFEQCMEIAPIIDELGFYFFEQPMGDQGEAQFDDYRRLKAAMPNVMLWGGETLRDREQVRPWVEQGIYWAVQTDCVRLGMTENWRIARLAQEHGVQMVPHNWMSALGTMCNTHFAAGVPNGHMCEFFMYENTPWRYGLFKDPHVVEDGYITLSEEPGFGVELVDIDELRERYPYDPNAQGVVPNPRFPHAYERAKARERAVRERYRG